MKCLNKSKDNICRIIEDLCDNDPDCPWYRPELPENFNYLTIRRLKNRRKYEIARRLLKEYNSTSNKIKYLSMVKYDQIQNLRKHGFKPFDR